LEKAVQRYYDVDKKLREFMDIHEEIFEEFYRLVEQQNNACDEAHDLVKRTQTSCAQFEYRPATTVAFDVEILKEKLPRSVFNRIIKVSVDRKSLEVLIERGEINSDDIAEARTENVVKKCFGPKPWRLS